MKTHERAASLALAGTFVEKFSYISPFGRASRSLFIFLLTGNLQAYTFF
jgi:hypothetical protein